ncbi:unnamed protein product [Cyprideis torosa]|uniref:Endonuclease n=1 Tax=Cyprideis torosa TaxID=163714 RepID=A0A7R8W6X8_9CRUS|nr:unnamed protein product [Cyprideis torosa]CAG0881798.1 unnamed protein product [Cyprideis torosa]
MSRLIILVSGSCGAAVGSLLTAASLGFWDQQVPPPGLPRVQAAVPVSPGTVLEPAVSPGGVEVKTTRTSQIMRLGFPSTANLRSYQDFVLSYDTRNRVPNWVFEHLTFDRIQKNPGVDRAKCEFKEDTSFHEYFRANNKDYKGSGFDRGHMAAAGNHWISQDACDETFYLSNIAPQVGKGFNRDSWNRLEKYVRSLTKRYDNVYVCTGPLYLPAYHEDGNKYVSYRVLGSNHVAVPTHFFKLVVGERNNGDLDLEAYVMRNAEIDDKIPLHHFQVPPDTIERASGLLFFSAVHRSKFKSINGKPL